MNGYWLKSCSFIVGICWQFNANGSILTSDAGVDSSLTVRLDAQAHNYYVGLRSQAVGFLVGELCESLRLLAFWPSIISLLLLNETDKNQCVG